MLFGIVLRTLLGAPLFFYLPGYLLDRLWRGDANALRGVERHVNRIVVSVLLTGWIAFVLAEIGWFSYGLLVAILVILCLAATILLKRRGGSLTGRSSAPAPLGIVAGSRRAESSLGSLRTILATLRFDHLLLLVALVFGIIVARPFEVIRGGLDAGVYANTGIAIARTGGIVQYDPIVAEIGQRAAAGDINAQQIATNIFKIQSAKRNLATRLRAAGFGINEGDLPQGRVVPQFFHFWPVWIAVFVSMLGPGSGLVATGAAGTLGVVLLGLIGRRLGGPVTGIVGAAFLALMTPQVWFSRMSTSEALAQALLLAGLWAFTHFADATERRERIWWGALVGVAFGEFALTRIDFFWAAGPTILLLLHMALMRRWHVGYTALAITLFGLLGHMTIHMLTIARAYFFDTAYARLQDYALTIRLSLPFLSPDLQDRFMNRWGSKYQNPWRLPLELTILALLALGLLALWRWPQPLLRAERTIRRRRSELLGLVVLALGALAIYGYLIRPHILTVTTILRPFEPQNWLRLQGYVGAPIAVPLDQFCKPGQQCKETLYIALANMVRLGWYLSPLGIVLGVVGGLRLWWRIDRRSWMFVVIATAYTLFYVRSLYGTEDQTYIYILRRYVPLVYPAFALGMAYAIASLIKPRPINVASSHRVLTDRLRLGLGAGLIAILLLFFVVTGRTVYAHTEYAGALEQVGEVSAQLRPQDIVLVRGGGADSMAVRETPELIAAPLTYLYGRNALPVKGSTPTKYPDAFADQVTRWRNEGRRVYVLLAASGSDMLFPGYAPRSVGVWSLRLREFQQLPDQKPKLSYVNEVPFHLYELVPAAQAALPATLTSDDTIAQVAGFYASEQPEPDQPRVVWTDGAGVLRLPASAQGRRLTLRVDGGKRPQSIGPAQVCLDAVAEPVPYPEGDIAHQTTTATGQKIDVLPWQELVCKAVDPGGTTIDATLPVFQPGTTILIRLRSPVWVPALTPPGAGTPASIDRRNLGVRFIDASLSP